VKCRWIRSPSGPAARCRGGCRAGECADGDDDQAVVALADGEGFLAGLWMPRQAIGLDMETFSQDMRKRAGQLKVASEVDSADLSGVSGTPTFFINGRRHYGAYDIDTLSTSVRAARSRVLISSPARRRRPA
jgi:hypothetical protein